MNRNQIKYLAALAMLADHIAWAFMPTDSIAAQLIHFAGRLTGPAMAFFLAEGYLHTRSVKRYALRLGIFALISWIPFSLFETGRWPTMHFGVIYTLLIGLLGIAFWDHCDWPYSAKTAVTVLLSLLSLPGDWAVSGVLWPLFFFIFREDEDRKWQAYYAVAAAKIAGLLVTEGRTALFQTGILAVPFLLRGCYNGESGSRHPFHKWFFFVFYPAHLLLLWALKRVW